MDPSLPLEHVSIAPEGAHDRPPSAVLLHGRGADEHDLLQVGDRLPDGLHLLSVRAPNRLGPGYTWYDLDLSAGGLQASQPDEADYTEALSLLDRFLEAAVEAYQLDPDRVGFVGFSQGAIVSLGSLLEGALRPAWVVGLHGYLPARYDSSVEVTTSDTPVFLGAGATDEVIPASRVERAAQRLEEFGYPVTLNTYDFGHGIAREELEDVAEFIDARLGSATSERV